jgi:hypothetical protein
VGSGANCQYTRSTLGKQPPAISAPGVPPPSRSQSMQLSGRTIIIATCTLALAMAGGAWWYNYGLSRQAAQFWGPEAAALIVAQSPLEFLELQPPGPATDPDAEMIAGRAVAAQHDLSDKQGLVHLRHVLTQDANFLWDARRRESIDVGYDWGYALRFGKGDRRLVVLLRRDFQQIGKLDGDGQWIDVLPSPRPAAAFKEYLSAVGVLPRANSAAAADDAAPAR